MARNVVPTLSVRWRRDVHAGGLGGWCKPQLSLTICEEACLSRGELKVQEY